MYTGKIIFSQILEYLPLRVFHQCVETYQGNFRVKEFSCLDQFLCMAFAQLTYRESLRDIEACLRSQKKKLYHMGIRSQVSRNTLANANNCPFALFLDKIQNYFLHKFQTVIYFLPKNGSFFVMLTENLAESMISVILKGDVKSMQYCFKSIYCRCSKLRIVETDYANGES